MNENQIKDIVEAINEVGGAIENNSRTAFAVDDYNMLAYIGENLWEIQNTLKKIEAKMK